MILFPSRFPAAARGATRGKAKVTTATQAGDGSATGGEGGAPFQLRGNSFTMMVLKVIQPGSADFFPQLESKVRQAPNFFRNAPVVLDFEDVVDGGRGLDLAAFLTQVRELHLRPIGAQHCPGDLRDAVHGLGLISMPTGKAARLEVARGEAPPPPPEPAYRPPVIVTEPIRSGQQVYAEKADLIVAASVSAGAEVLADGSIHIYGALRGRALAGISGEAGARIFCQSLEAELVSINGLYQVSEDIEPERLRKPAQIWQAGGYIHIGAL